MSLKATGYQPPKNREDAYKKLSSALNFAVKTGDKTAASNARKLVQWLKNDDAIKQSAKKEFQPSRLTPEPASEVPTE